MYSHHCQHHKLCSAPFLRVPPIILVLNQVASMPSSHNQSFILWPLCAIVTMCTLSTPLLVQGCAAAGAVSPSDAAASVNFHCAKTGTYCLSRCPCLLRALQASPSSSSATPPMDISQYSSFIPLITCCSFQSVGLSDMSVNEICALLRCCYPQNRMAMRATCSSQS